MDATCAENSQSLAVAGKLLAWYDASARQLPWRSPPGTPPPDPYRVWLSEVMLQQTTVAAVKPHFAAFTRRWPTVGALAAADDADVMAAWAGLGYYARARNLLACAREVVRRGGRFPDTEEELRKLPGLGVYAAAAIAAIAFGRRAVVVDANVERVVARLFTVDEPLPGARKALRQLADRVTPSARCGDFAQALMDLGAMVCTPRDPRCLLCPLAGACAARAAGDPARFPVKAAKAPRPERSGHAFWISRDGAQGREVWLVRRPAKGMLGGMRALPDDGWSARADGSGLPPCQAAGTWQAAGAVRHVFTHFSLALKVMVGQSFGEAEPGGSLEEWGPGEWWPAGRLDDAGLPTLFAKAAELALAQEGEAEGEAK